MRVNALSQGRLRIGRICRSCGGYALKYPLQRVFGWPRICLLYLAAVGHSLYRCALAVQEIECPLRDGGDVGLVQPYALEGGLKVFPVGGYLVGFL